MLKLLVLCLVVGFVVAENIVRIKTVVNRGQRPNSLFRQRLSSLKSVNQTLIGVYNDYYYTGVIHVGTPPREFIVDFDTGSPDLWLAGPSCRYENGRGCSRQEHRYDLSKSSTGKDLLKSYSIHYGIGFANGRYVSDVVGLSPKKTDSETKPSFTLAYATSLSQDYDTSSYDGIFGLSFSSPNSEGQSYIEYLRDNNVFEKPIFSIWLDRNASGHPLGGEIIFGAKDPDHCGDDLLTIKTNVAKPWWTFNIEKAFLDGQKISDNARAITDTGTSFIMAPPDAYKVLSKNYPLRDPRTGSPTPIDCDKYKKIELTIQIAGKLLKLTGDDLIIGDGTSCEIGIFPNDENEWILGDSFIKGYCQIHNYKDETVTFASRKHTKLGDGGFAPRNLTYLAALIPLFLTVLYWFL